MPRTVRKAGAVAPGAAANGVGAVTEALGARIRHRRQEAGLTVRGLAAAVGVSPSLISQIERGRATPSVATLWSIATELRQPVADLFSSSDADGEPVPAGKAPKPTPVQPHETRKSVTLAGGVRWERLTSASDDELDFIYVVYPPGAESCPPNALTRHGGREFGYVIKGTLAVEIGFDEYVLRPNDSISFDSAMPHRLRSVGDEAVIAVWAVMHRHSDERSSAFTS
jgi:transcriptional regulator with XRE-family HTH domain